MTGREMDEYFWGGQAARFGTILARFWRCFGVFLMRF